MNTYQKTPDASQCDCEPRNHLAMGSCHHCLALENEIIITSVVGSDKETCLFLQGNSPHPVLKANKTSPCLQTSPGSFRGTGHTAAASSHAQRWGGGAALSGASQRPWQRGSVEQFGACAHSECSHPPALPSNGVTLRTAASNDFSAGGAVFGVIQHYNSALRYPLGRGSRRGPAPFLQTEAGNMPWFCNWDNGAEQKLLPETQNYF